MLFNCSSKYAELEIALRSRTEKELTNRIDQLAELFKCDLLILSPSEISEQFLASWIRLKNSYLILPYAVDILRLLHRIYSRGRVYFNMPPKIELIAAACENMGIGINGDLPWRLKTEMAFFTRMTTDTKHKNKRNIVLMGRRTWECIPKKYRPLKDRINMVLTSQSFDYGDDAIVCKSIPHALDMIAGMQDQVERVWVIGGSSIYKSAMESPHFQRLYLTRIKKKFECDTFFPPIPNDFLLIKDPTIPQGTQEENGVEFVYEVYERR